MKSHRRFSRKFILFLASLTLIFSAYLHFGLVPGKLKDVLIEQIESTTSFKIRFDKLLILPFRGISFYNLRIMDQNSRPIFSSGVLATDIKLIEFLRENKIIVRNLYLDSPFYDLALENTNDSKSIPIKKTQISGQIQVPVLPTNSTISSRSLSEGPDFFLPENVYLERIQIQNGTLILRQRPNTPPIEVISSIHIHMGYQKPPILEFEGSCQLGNPSYSKLNLNGAWDLLKASYDFTFQTKTSRLPQWLLDYQKNNFLVLKSGSLFLNCHFLSLSENKISFHAKTQIQDYEVQISKITSTGKALVDAKGAFDLETKKTQIYNGSAKLTNAKLVGISDEIASLDLPEAELEFGADFLKLKSVRGKFENLNFVAEGIINSFTELKAHLEIKVLSSIDQLIAMIPKNKNFNLSGYQFTGNTSLLTKLDGSLKNPQALRKTHWIQIVGGKILNSSKHIDISSIDSEIFVDSANYQIKAPHLVMRGEPYSLTLTIPATNNTFGSAHLRSKSWALETSFKPDSSDLLLGHATFKEKGFSAVFDGKIKNYLDQPLLDLKGEFDFNLQKSGWLIYTPFLQNQNIRGSLSGDFTLLGIANKILEWDLKLNGVSDILSVQDISLTDFRIQASLKDGFLDIPYIHSQSYGGLATARMTFNMNDPSLPFNVKVDMSHLNLTGVARDLHFKNENLSGDLNLSVELSGLAKSSQSIQGRGSLFIQNGILWQTDIFKKMGNLSVPIPLVKVEGLDWVTFHSLSTTFKITQSRLWTPDLTLNSEPVDLLLKGSIGFDQTLDLLMHVQFSRAIHEGAIDSGGIVPFVVSQAAKFISEYYIRGTFSKPQYEKAGPDLINSFGQKLNNILSGVQQ